MTKIKNIFLGTLFLLICINFDYCKQKSFKSIVYENIGMKISILDDMTENKYDNIYYIFNKNISISIKSIHNNQSCDTTNNNDGMCSMMKTINELNIDTTTINIIEATKCCKILNGKNSFNENYLIKEIRCQNHIKNIISIKYSEEETENAEIIMNSAKPLCKSK
ncbi:MAG: hypothetical protein MJ211_00130 [Bacteroidales bacterium]|nr:hypothetical protein [Bacteroidales bacterium]